MPNYNSNNLILIPKTSVSDSIDLFRPIVLDEFLNLKLFIRLLLIG